MKIKLRFKRWYDNEIVTTKTIFDTDKINLLIVEYYDGAGMIRAFDDNGSILNINVEWENNEDMGGYSSFKEDSGYDFIIFNHKLYGNDIREQLEIIEVKNEN